MSALSMVRLANGIHFDGRHEPGEGDDILGDRAHAAVNTAVRSEVLGEHCPALTVIITGIFDPAWLVEIEAIAAA